MKKLLLFEFTQSLFRKMILRKAAFAVLTLLTAQSSFAQKWNIIGTENDISTGISTVASAYTTITVLGDVPYVSYVEGSASGIGKVKKRNNTTGAWEQVGGDIAANISYSRIYKDNTGKLYVAYLDNANSSRLAVATYNGTAWETVGGAGVYVSAGSATHAISSYTTRSDLAFDSNNVPYITYSERVTATTGAYVKRFNGTSWEAVGSGTGLVSADLWTVGNAIAIDAANVPYIVYIKVASSATTETAGTLFAYRINTTTSLWENLAIPLPVTGGSTAQTGTTGARHSTIAMDSDNNPIIGFGTTLNSNRPTFLRFTKSTSAWDYLGNTGTRDGSRITLVSDAAGNLYDIFHDTLQNGGRSNTIRVYKRVAGTVSVFAELVNTPITSLSGVGIDAAGANQTTAYVTPLGLSISNVAIAVGTNTNTPYIVYTKNSTNGGTVTPVVRVFDPLILSKSASAITVSGATLGGEVLATAPAVGTITERGVVCATAMNPTTTTSATSFKVVDGATTTGVFTSSLTGITAGTIYYARAYIIYADATVAYGDNKIFTTVATTIWDGTTWSSGAPTATAEAIIDGTYSTTTNGTITAKKLTVNAGKSLTVNTGTTVTVQNEVINNGSLVVENNANLIQVLGTTNTNTGNVVVNRNSSPLLRLDYTLWSSPVAGQKLAAFSPLTSQSPNRFHTYDSTLNLYAATTDPITTNFTAGAGYLIRMPNTADAFTPTAYAGVFTGVPNNGDVPFALSTAGGGYNLVGNPYPSTINLFTLQANNSTVIGNTFYMWRKTNGAGTAYCSYVPTTLTTGTYVSNGNTQSPAPGTFVGNIQTGQGFFVVAATTPTGPLVFKNAQRVTTASSFFKTKEVAAAYKVWLNATNAAGDFSQMAVTYFDGATQSVDAFDGKYINDSPLALTSNINNEEYTIQGRPAFDASDIVALNFKTAVAGNYTIAIDHSEGVFAAGQSVFLTDATTGTETDLTTSSYTFTAAAGTANSRFSLSYQKTLGANKPVFNENSVTVFKNKGTLYVTSANVTIANIKVYDVQGRLIAELKNVKSTSASISNLKAANQVLVVKITLEDHKVVTKKVVN